MTHDDMSLIGAGGSFSVVGGDDIVGVVVETGSHAEL